MENKTKKYKYFVSYILHGEYNGIGFGNINIERTEKIKSIEDIREIEEKMKKEKFNNYDVAILNYKEL